MNELIENVDGDASIDLRVFPDDVGAAGSDGAGCVGRRKMELITRSQPRLSSGEADLILARKPWYMFRDPGCCGHQLHQF